MPELPYRPYFGTFVQVDIASVRAKVGERKFKEYLRIHDINKPQVEALETGRWRQLAHRDLFFLWGLARELEIRDFVTVIESPIWKTFNKRITTVGYYGISPSERRNDADSRFIGRIQKRLEIVSKPVGDSDNRKDIVNRIGTGNVLSVGASKTNVATDICLTELWAPAPCPIVFECCELVREKPTAVRTTAITNGLRIHNITTGHTDHFNSAEGRVIGIVVVCKHPFGSPGTTVVAAGVNKEATNVITKELTERHEIYRQYATATADIADGKPVLMLYDSSAKEEKWSVWGAQKKKKRLGRPPNPGR